ncbi:MAG: hypothetical protein WCC06_10510 [Candidatus Aminicenantales bacterium]
MRQAFIIIQIGNKELDKVCEKAIVPALKSCGFDPKRVDKHNMGGLLKSEIVNFILSSDIIIADLTNERPNCYLEVGYSMGANKFRNLILTAREDHNPDSPNNKKGGPKIHFDLIGYDILFWDPTDLETFRSKLEKRIHRRTMTLPTIALAQRWDNEWIEKHKEAALAGLKRNNLSGFMEIRMVILNYQFNSNPRDLSDAAEKAQIHTFGWPIGAMYRRNLKYMPKPTTEGIITELDLENGESYDYWTLGRDGAFYLLKSLFEDKIKTEKIKSLQNSISIQTKDLEKLKRLSEEKRKPGYIFINTRIVRITESLLYAVRLYSSLKVPLNSSLLIGIRHGGLKDRELTATGERALTMLEKYKCHVDDEVYTEIETELEKVESSLFDLVEKFTQPLFEVFDYFSLNNRVLEDIVDNFVKGRVT